MQLGSLGAFSIFLAPKVSIEIRTKRFGNVSHHADGIALKFFSQRSVRIF